MEPVTQATSVLDKYGWQGGFAIIFGVMLFLIIRYVFRTNETREGRLIATVDSATAATVKVTELHNSTMKQVTDDCHKHQLDMQTRQDENHRKALTLILGKGGQANELIGGE